MQAVPALWGMRMVLPGRHDGEVGSTDARVSLLTRRRALRLSEAARAAMQRAPVVDDHGRYERTHVVGHDPVRVLLFGSGALIGYGVVRRQDAVDGWLAEQLAEALQRGITVESRVRLGLPTHEAVQSLGGAGTATFSVAIWSPRFGEELVHSRGKRARTTIRDMLQQFRAGSAIPLVLCQLPMPIGSDWRTMLRRPRVERFNRLLAEEAGRVARTTVVDTGAYRPTRPETVDRDWHRAFAERLVPAAIDALGGPAA